MFSLRALGAFDTNGQPTPPEPHVFINGPHTTTLSAGVDVDAAKHEEVRRRIKDGRERLKVVREKADKEEAEKRAKLQTARVISIMFEGEDAEESLDTAGQIIKSFGLEGDLEMQVHTVDSDRYEGDDAIIMYCAYLPARDGAEALTKAWEAALELMVKILGTWDASAVVSIAHIDFDDAMTKLSRGKVYAPENILYAYDADEDQAQAIAA